MKNWNELIDKGVNGIGVGILPLTFVAIFLSTGFTQNDEPKPIGQTAPPNMLFIPGDSATNSFYISQSPEPNINYALYLKWLTVVYQSNRQVIIEAYPRTKLPSGKVVIDTAYLNNILFNPKHAYEPVLGLTWLQIQDYLLWKTDRINELILIKTDVYYPNTVEQQDEMNFNIEAFLTGQYGGNVKTRKVWKYITNYQNGKLLRSRYRQSDHEYPIWQDGLFFTGYRLPTYREFHLAQGELDKQEVARQKDVVLEFSKMLNYYYEWELDEFQMSNIMTYPFDEVQLPLHKVSSVENLKYWLLNPTKNLASNWMQAYKQGGALTGKTAMRLNRDGTPWQKDSLGRIGYRNLGLDRNGVVAVERHNKREFNISHNRVYDDPIDPQEILELRTAKRIPVFIERATIHSGSLEIEGQYENECATKTGFYAIIAYSSFPVAKKYKVKW